MMRAMLMVMLVAGALLPLPEEAWRLLDRGDYLRFYRRVDVKVVDLTSRNGRGLTALHVSASRGDFRMTVCLLKMGADVKATDKQQKTPLHLAAQAGSFPVVWYLVKYGADITARDAQQAKPEDYASGKDASNIRKYLVAMSGKGAALPVSVIARFFVDEGYVFLNLGLTDDAIQSFSKAIDLDNTGESGTRTRGRTYELRGIAYYSKGRYQDAVREFNAAIRENPAEPSFYYNRGAAYLDAGNCASATKDFDHHIVLVLSAVKDPNEMLPKSLAKAQAGMARCAGSR